MLTAKTTLKLLSSKNILSFFCEYFFFRTSELIFNFENASFRSSLI